MKKPRVFTTIKKQYTQRAKARRELIGLSNEALSLSKRATFALHRDDPKAANKLLGEAKTIFKQVEKGFKRFPDLRYEGAYKAALEEYAESLLFQGYLATGKIEPIDERAMHPFTYVGGLSDATGEMVRYAVRQVTNGNTDEVARAQAVTEMVIEFLLNMDLTGPLRQKFDQAKKNLRRLEEMRYDLSLRKE